MNFLHFIHIKQAFADSADQVIGTINVTTGILQNKAIDDKGKLIGVMILLNSLLKIIFVIAGLWAFFNFIIAGYGFLSAGGDSKNISKAWDRIWQSFVGLAFIVASFLFAALAGLVLFKDATAILQPSLGTK